MRYKPTLLILLALASCYPLVASRQPALSWEEASPLPVRVVREYHEDNRRQDFDRLLAEWGNNKELPAGYELQTLLALSHYPELRDTRIRFIVDDVNIPLSSRPYWASMHRAAQGRTYLVIIDSKRDSGREELLLSYQPFNAQIGIIGHELAHTVYYLDRSFFGIASDALCQLSRCAAEFERATDRRLVDYGLGWQRFDHSVFLRESFGMDPMSEANTGGTYLGPRELLELMEANPAYQETLAQR